MEAEFIDWMLQLCDSDIGLNYLLIAFQMKAFLLAHAPELCVDHEGKFKVSRTFVRTWPKERLSWSFQNPTSNASKLPLDWEKRVELLTMRITCLVSTYLIPQSLVINIDQTIVHLLPVGNKHTYAIKGASDVKVAGRRDKRQVTTLVSCSAISDILSIQVIFSRKTD